MRTNNIRTILLTTALTVPVAGPALAQEDACSSLEQIMQSDRVADAELDMPAIEGTIAAGNAEECQAWIVELSEQGIDLQQDDAAAAEGQAEGAETADAEAEAEAGAEATAEAEAEGEAVTTEQATVRLEDEVVIAGTVYLDRQPPAVDIQGGDAEVDVSTAPPDVTVREGQAQIVIRQAPPTITLDMPQPTIRIEQPAPEIIITMPEPGVDVATQRPQVEVRQAEPTITVTQARPTVDLELRRAEEGEEPGFVVTDRASGESFPAGEPGEPTQVAEAQVTMTANQPVVNYAESDQQANVSIERAEPTVTFEQAEPQVEVTSAGEPQVEWVQAGEATVTFEEASAEQAQQDGEQQQAAADVPDEQAETEQAVAEAEQSAAEADVAAEEAEQVAAEAEAMAGGETEETAEADAAATEEVGGAEDVAAADATEAEPATEETTAEATTETTAGGAGPMVEREGYQMVQIDQVEAETLTGSTLYGVNDEDIGNIGDLVLSDDGQIDAVIVEVGGFLGIGQKEVSVPFDTMTILRSEDGGDVRAYADLTQEELEGMEAAN